VGAIFEKSHISSLLFYSPHFIPFTRSIQGNQKHKGRELMKGQQKHLMLRVMMGVSILMLLHLNLTGIIWYNHTDISFKESLEEGSYPKEKAMREYLIEGAQYFLESYSDFLLFLNKIELAELRGFDWNELRFILNRVIEKVQYANDLIGQLKQKADVTPYNPVIINNLLNFDYDAFADQEGLIKPIFKDVKAFLSKGKIREMYGEALSDTQHILTMANTISKKLKEDIFPGVSNLHALNQAYHQYMLFGEYAARVFQKIK
jgi:hypothetical protein